MQLATDDATERRVEELRSEIHKMTEELMELTKGAPGSLKWAKAVMEDECCMSPGMLSKIGVIKALRRAYHLGFQHRERRRGA